MPEISVIVPVYNSQAFLKECIESVLSQSFQDWELIIVDDGSTDQSNAICREYEQADKRIMVLSKSNGGLSSARNAALDVAKGKYVFFLDADDELYPHTLSHLHEVAETSDTDITIGHAAYTLSKPAQDTKVPNVVLIDGRQLCIDILYQKPGTDNSACWRLFRTSLFDGLRFYNGWYEDLEIFHKLLFKAKIIGVTDSIVYYYRKHPKSFINCWSDGRRDIVKVTEKIMREYSGDPIIEKAAQNRHFSANYNLLIALLHDNPNDKTGVESCWNVIKSLRTKVLFDRNSRTKDRIGALVSYFGKSFIKRLS